MQTNYATKLIFFLINIFLIHTCAFSQVAAKVGEPVNLNISVVKDIKNSNLKKCRISIFFPNGEKIFHVLSAPDYKTSFEFIPQLAGKNTVNWVGESDYNFENGADKIVRNTLKNIGEILTFKPITELVKGCPSEGSILVIAKENTATIVSLDASPIVSSNISASTQAKKTEEPTQKKMLVTADLPNVFNAPIDQDKLQAITATNPEFKDAIQGFTMKKIESVTLMMIQAKQGEPYAQFFYGLAHTEDWTNIYDKRMACYWFRQKWLGKTEQVG